MRPHRNFDQRALRMLCAFASALLRDARGNAIMLIAAALVPMLALLGGSIDMGRSYLSESRLQQACDAGVLAARKRLGTEVANNGEIPADVADIGARFFNLNFRDGQYGTADREFKLTLEGNFSLTGEATVNVPTTLMRLFGQENVAIAVKCGAQVGMANTDVMMVLDVTGSMNETNPGDSSSKITLLRSTIQQFYGELEGNKPTGTRIRYGFVPYSTNVNVGGLLKDDWVVNNWTYQSRTLVGGGGGNGKKSFWAVGSVVSGSLVSTKDSQYPANGSNGSYSCSSPPSSTLKATSVQMGTVTLPYAGPPAGTETRTTYWYTYNGAQYSVALKGNTCQVTKQTYTNYVVAYDWVTIPALQSSSKFQYQPVASDVSSWRGTSNGCIEERATYQIDDYDNVDLTRALDLDLDRVPTPGDSTTQWRPQFPEKIYARSLKWDNSGSFTAAKVTTNDEYFAPLVGDTAACPTAAQKLKEMTSSQLSTYLAGLKVAGSTYHDIGLIWGGRLLSPTGIFASENADVSPSQPTNRNLIMMTDGQTSALDLSYTAYGIEPIDQRRWAPGSARSLTQTVEDRFSFVCQEVKKKNITVWFIAFGTELNPIMTDCAGPGHAFQASNGQELAEVFKKIAGGISNLRLTK
ncbi:MAG: TadE/TadG family type IV pilus assembly protein [Novosphingobium sp.]